MAAFSIFESFFFLMLATTFVLILLLVYHFKNRITSMEEKNDKLLNFDSLRKETLSLIPNFTEINELPSFDDSKVTNTSPYFFSEIIKIRELDYFFTNSISRASKTMSECRQINQDSKKTGTDN